MTETKSGIVFKPITDPIYVHPLRNPITYGSSIIEELPIRKPSSKDLLFIGSPVIADPTSNKEARLDFGIVLKLVQALSGLPEKIVLDQIEPDEIIDLGWKIGSFFIPGWQDLLPAIKRLREASSAQDEQPVA